MSGTIEFSLENGIDRIRFNRPELKNALSQSMCAQLAQHVREIQDDPAVRVIVIEGVGKDFCTGADVGSMAELTNGTPQQRAALVDTAIREVSHGIFVPLGQLPQPIIVSARGWAVGAGFQFAAMADLVVASETARFSIPLVNLAHTTDHGESYYLPRKVGMARAAQMMLLAEPLNAADADRYGFVNWVVADDQLEAKTSDIANRLASGAYTAVVGMKALLRDSLHNPLLDQFDQERRMAKKCVATEDFVEAIHAFNERRRPVFNGR